jgi:primosomal protein N' (replication factor Y)
MTGKENLYARVILPLAVEGSYTYSVPDVFAGLIAPGSRVLVSFGKKRIYTAIVHEIQALAQVDFTPKPLLDVLDQDPLVGEKQLQLWDWMSDYYMCTPGEVMRAALPSGLRPESESRARINVSWVDQGDLDSYERLLLEVIKDQGEVKLDELQLSGISKNPLRILKQLVEKGAVELNEFVRSSVAKRRVSYVRFTGAYEGEASLLQLLDQLARAPRQKELVEKMLDLSGAERMLTNPWILKKELLREGVGPGALAALIKKQVVEQIDREEMEKGRSADSDLTRSPHALNENQSLALKEVRKQFQRYQSVLLHGVTSSGKTELYIHLIQEQLKKKKQVLYLLPEIALTTQIIQRMREVFGRTVGVYHSRYSDSERIHVYRNLLGLTDEKSYGLIIGVRSAIFLPFQELGLVIIDEEHETTFKQHDPAPRYHARDSAQVLALYHDARVILGTATPSFESLYNSRKQKFGFVSIPTRYGDVQAPEILLANIRVARKRKQMVSHFTPELVLAINETLEKKEQIILFQNRRGYSNYIICNECTHIPKCSRCDVSLTYHKISGKMECHYCGRKENVPGACPSCSSTSMHMKGFGTEKIEDELALVFEGARVGRLDTDAARSARGYEKILGAFANGQLDILIGTQILSKGLDFENVSLVGVLDADSMLNFPDFRAFERSFQLISQVSGRAGRRSKQGKVIIQTMDPDHPVIRYICNNDYDGLYADQMEERQVFGYPPFRRMIRISFRHKIPSILDGACDLAARELKEIFSSRVYGPQYPAVRKVQNYFVKQIILKVEREASYERARELLKGVLDRISANEVYRSIRISVDVDPY